MFHSNLTLQRRWLLQMRLQHSRVGHHLIPESHRSLGQLRSERFEVRTLVCILRRSISSKQDSALYTTNVYSVYRDIQGHKVTTHESFLIVPLHIAHRGTGRDEIGVNLETSNGCLNSPEFLVKVRGSNNRIRLHLNHLETQ